MSANKPDIFTYATFDIQALCQLASGLRNNTACTCNRDQIPASGGFNWAIFISFKDGMEWVFRSPRTGYGTISREVASKLLDSEATTLKYVRGNSDIRVPHVHSHRSVLSAVDRIKTNSCLQLNQRQ